MRITGTHLYFYAGYLGNFFACRFTLDVPGAGRFPCTSSEQAFMILKAAEFGDSATLARIAQARSAKEAKDLGRQVSPYDDARWDAVRDDRMYDACLAKFSQNAGLASQLAGTGRRALVEASASDRIWGIGLGLDDERILDPSRWRGQGRLGPVLERVRETLVAGRANPVRRGPPLGRIRLAPVA